MGQKAEEQAVIQYLKTKPYLGDSAYEQKDEVKAIMSPRAHRFEKNLKLWGTVSLSDVDALIKSGIWWPRGIDRSWGCILKRHLSLALLAESTEREVKAEEESAKARQNSIILEMGPSREDRLQEEKERSRDVLPTTSEELAALENIGVASKTVAASATWEDLPGHMGHLGPRGGISTAGRLVSFIGFEHARLRVVHPLGTDLTTLYAQSSRELAEKLNSLVGKSWAVVRKTNNENRDVTQGVFRPAVCVNSRRRAFEHVVDNETIVSKPWTNPPKLAKGSCRKCWKALDVQFLECTCRGGWMVCRKCPEGNQIVHPVAQPCCHVLKNVKV